MIRPSQAESGMAGHGGGGGMTEQIVVPFEGEGGGVGELTWSQYEIWPIMQRERSSFSVGGVLPLPPGSTVQGVAADLRFAMSRNAALRTRLGFAADGRPLQVVASSGEALLEVVDAGESDPADTGAALHRRYDRKAFDLAGEWPIRWAVIVSRGAATHLVSLISHFAADGMGVMAMLDDLASRDPATGLAQGPAPAMQPLELARLQRTPAALRQSDAALRHWQRLLRTIPARRFARSTGESEPRYWHLLRLARLAPGRTGRRRPHPGEHLGCAAGRLRGRACPGHRQQSGGHPGRGEQPVPPGLRQDGQPPVQLRPVRDRRRGHHLR